jgi:hypothetical protein
MHSWGLEIFWVVLWRQCSPPVQTLCRVEIWYVLGYSVKTVFTACTKLCTAEVWKCSGLFCEDSAYCLHKLYAQLRSGNVLGYFVKRVLSACINTMHSWGLEMFWVIPWWQCLLLVQALCTAEAWKCSELFCKDIAYCLCNHYANLRPGNFLGCSVKTVFPACTNTMQSWGLEMFCIIPDRQSFSLYKHCVQLN